MDTYTTADNTVKEQTDAPSPQNVPPPPKKRRRPGRRKKIIKNCIAAVITLAVIGALVWFTYYVFFSPPPEYYLTGEIEKWDEINNVINGWGYLQPESSEQIYISQPGTILECNVWQGAQVREGDILAVIDSSSIDKAINELNKQIAAIEESIAADYAGIEKVQAKLNEANAEQIAMKNAATMTAPFAGRIINAEKLTLGQSIYKGMPLGSLVDDSQMKLVLYFSYGYENDIYINQPCTVSIPGAMSTVSGKVTGIEKVRHVGTDGSVSFEVEVTMPNPGTLVSDMPATASMNTPDGETILPAETGTLEYAREVILTAESQGPLKTNNIRNYYTYEQGDLLLVLDFEPDTSIEEGYLESIKTYQNNIDGKNEQIADLYDKIDLELEKMDGLTIRAPMDGTVATTDIYPGMTINESSPPSIIIAKLDTLILRGSVWQSNIQLVSEGMPVDVIAWVWGEQTHIQGTLTSIDKTADQSGGGASFPVVISVDNSQGQLMESTSADFNILLSQATDAIVVPVQAVKNIGSGEYVFLQPKDGNRPENAVDLEEGFVPPGFFAIPVKCGIQSGRYIQITEGLLMEWAEKKWKVFTQKTDVMPSPSPSTDHDFSTDSEDFAAGYFQGYEDGLKASPSPDENPDDLLPGSEFPIDEFPITEGEQPAEEFPVVDGEFPVVDGEFPVDWDLPVTDEGAVIDEGAIIDEGSIIDEGAIIGDDAVIDEGAIIGDGTIIGDGNSTDGSISIMPMPMPRGETR